MATVLRWQKNWKSSDAENQTMKIELWAIGKTQNGYLAEGIGIFENRLKHYANFQIDIIPNVKNAGTLPPIQLKEKEAEIVVRKLGSSDFLILLDEKGREYDSLAFAKYLAQQMQKSPRRLIFAVGGAFGFAESLRSRANDKIALSKMTFSHQMVRLIFVEQLYRAMTILNNEPYHNP